ncbi:unnamed protein product [Arabidopsis lyrata]|uniref:Transcriptional factor B3 family protein n=1 Tax=Arabidopsis lyrata subsp. lyrata TaxID=81972 RepID=D7LXR4_ARALL|nr:B3 domain-containing protein At5g18090 [Arabidopsis lyrata subsp. lyrata]EFH48059.1 transcriptional factor B3 family protein [Arabidopsis lyrata subsp. lyrata]CAH8271466.1 unnamed protein product [Arabidopsis lyrata]|eukprot:XP_020877797.1 B3 domain-containing protein At5g18090 [Arabidopsis lyrata subsp. lyrata]
MKNRAFGQIMDDAENPGFFKILRPADLSSEIMRGIPLNFIKSISDEEFSHKMVLKVSWGSSWPIKICRNPSFYFMEKKGWDQFLSDNGLGNNEFLTFTHQGNMCFSVDIYQIDGKELLTPRRSATIASSSGRNKREQRKNIYEDVKKEEEIESWSESSYPGLKAAESTGRRQKHVTKKKKKMTMCNDSEDDNVSLVPEFTLTIKKSYLFFLGVPKMFEELHMPREATMFKIHDPEGKRSWDVMYKLAGTQSRFCAGWIRLAKELGLVIGDVCTFTLIKPTEMLVKVSK